MPSCYLCGNYAPLDEYSYLVMCVRCDRGECFATKIKQTEG